MRVTINGVDKSVAVDGKALPVDTDSLPADVSVIHWDDAKACGWIELVNDGFGPFRPNLKIVDFAPYRPLVDAWQAADAQAEATG